MQALPQMIHLEMDEQKTKQLKAMLGICQRLGAETRYHPEHRYFTAMVWTGWDTPCGMREALAVQQKIQRTAAQYAALAAAARNLRLSAMTSSQRAAENLAICASSAGSPIDSCSRR